MPRLPRKMVETQYFHVMVQGLNREKIFERDASKGFYLKSLNEKKEVADIKLLAYCIMDNHAHMLVWANTPQDLGVYFRKVNAEFAQVFNHHYERVGYVFRDRFKSEPIYDIKYLGNCIRYIHNNPVNANIVVSAEDYQYSSYRNFLEQRGIVDFDAFNGLLDCSPQNMRAIMAMPDDDIEFMDVKDEVKKDYESINDVLPDVCKKYDIIDITLFKQYKNAPQALKEIIERTGLTCLELSKFLYASKSYLYKIL